MRKLRRDRGVPYTPASIHAQELNFRALIAESWQKSRHSPLLWGSSVGLFTASILLDLSTSWFKSHRLNTPDANLLGYACLILTAGLLLIFASIFLDYLLQFAAGRAALGAGGQLREAWNSFKSQFLRWCFLGLIILAYEGILLLFAYSISRLFHLDNWTTSIVVRLLLVLFSAPAFLAPFGLLFASMGVLQSMGSGFKVFSKERSTFVLLLLFASLVPFLLIGMVTLLRLWISGQVITYEAYVGLGTTPWMSLLNDAVNALIYPLSTTALALGYFKVSPTIVRPKT